jgi:RHS repeat-associated protein
VRPSNPMAHRTSPVLRLAQLLVLLLLAVTPACSGCGDEDRPAATEGDEETNFCAPPRLSDGTPARFLDAVRFLFDGPCPRQTGVEAAVFAPERASVVLGAVVDLEGQPLEGVRVDVPAEPRFGETRTREDGRFELVVNGGGTVSVRLTLEGRLPSRRRFPLKPNRFRDVGEIALIEASEKETPITFGTGGWQIAFGEKSTDAHAPRTAVVAFPPGVRATAGEAPRARPLDGGTLRITEHTRGERGPNAMPADLPPTSGYTYATSFVFDEAPDEAITFDRPVFAYVDNFLHMAVGTTVPAGALGPDDDQWQPDDSGRIVQLLAGGQLDVDGDGRADGDDALRAIGASAGELAALAQALDPNKSYMRVPLTHFSAWDFNWGFAPPPDSIFPPEGSGDDDPGSPCEDSGGSYFECETRTLGEDIPVVGTGLALHYRSDRVPGRTAALSHDVIVTGPTVPPSAKRAEVEITVLGVTEKTTHPAAPNVVHRFTWNGRDAFGREWPGGAMAEVKVSLVYDGVYTDTRVFGAWASGEGTVTGDPTRREATLTRRYEVHLGVWDQTSLGFGMWSLTPHHVYDPSSGTLYLGDGRRRVTATMPPLARSIAGTGVFGTSGDGGQATEAVLSYPEGIAIGPEGAIYVAEDVLTRRIRKIENGVITTVAGTGAQGDPGHGDGGPATSANLTTPKAIAVRADGSVCFSETLADRVRCVGADGVIRTILGGGAKQVLDEEVLAREANVSRPGALAVADDGSLFVVAGGSSAIFRLDARGYVERVAGGGNLRDENALARRSSLSLPSGLAVGPDGSVYVSEEAGNRVRRIDPSGRISTFAGTSEAGDSGDGGAATAARLRGPTALAVDGDGVVYIADAGNRRVRRVVRGIITTYAGGGDRDVPGGSAPGLRSVIARGLAIGPGGSAVYASDHVGMRVLSFVPTMPALTAAEIALPSEDGHELFVFDAGGRHLRTLDALTSTTRLSFRYADARLVGIDDPHGNTVTIARDDGLASAITGPFGHVTRLTHDSAGMLADVEDPLGRHERFRYAPGGLLAERIDAGGGVHAMAYDAQGLLVSDGTAEGATYALSTLAVGKTEVKTGLGRTEIYERTGGRGTDDSKTVTHEDGTKSRWTNRRDGSSLVTWADGTTLVTVRDADPRFGMLAPFGRSHTLTLPSGLSLEVQRSWEAELRADGSLVSLSGERRTSDGAAKAAYDAATRTWTETSAAGRVTKTRLDADGRVVRIDAPGLSPLTVRYDARGRVAEIARGPSRTTSHYDASGALSEIEDALGRRSRVERDAALRVTAAFGPDGARTALAYDAMDDLVSLAPPGKGAHAMTWGKDGLLASYTAPGAGTQRAAYDADRLLTGLALEDGSRLDVAYDAAGRPSRYGFAGGAVTVGYDSTSGRATRFSSGRESILLGYDGLIVSRVDVAGAVSGSLAWTFDGRLRPATETVSGGNELAFRYDRDGLPTNAGPMTLGRDAPTGRLTMLLLGSTSSEFAHTDHGEMASYVVRTPQGTLLDAAYTYDALSRVTQKRENGVTFAYEYDVAGRLARVKRDGVVAATYTYDANGNRTDRGMTADAQDRITASTGVTYTYTPRGERATRAAAAGTTRYAYDGRGHLARVTLPAGGGDVSYVLDAFGRRIARRRDGAITHRWLYSDELIIAAELAADGSVVSRFVYGRGHNAPDAMLRGGVTYLFVRDHLGSVRYVVDAATGAVAQELAYDAYGVVVADTSPGFQPFGFAGGLYDPDTSLVHYGAREYDPETGQFLRRDPSGFAGGLNLYGYAGGDPVNYVDRDGNFIAAAVIVGGIEGGVMGGLDEAVDQALDPNRGGYDCGAIAAAAGRGAVTGAAAGALGGRLAKSGSGRQCFAPGTAVHTERGAVAIEDVAVGERVLSRGEEGELVYQEVTRLFRRDDAERIELRFEDDGPDADAGQLLVTTPEHPFHVAGAGWVPAGELRLGDAVVTAEGRLARLAAALTLAEPGPVFNFEVAGTHSYFVGDAALWVHNACNPGKGSQGGERAGKAFTPKGKQQVKKDNAAANKGQTTCAGCERPTVPAQQGQRGVTPPGNETHVDHIIPKIKGGDGSPSNGQVLCRDCNLSKGAKWP